MLRNVYAEQGTDIMNFKDNLKRVGAVCYHRDYSRKVYLFAPMQKK